MLYNEEMDFSFTSDLLTMSDFPRRVQEAVSRQYPNCWQG